MTDDTISAADALHDLADESASDSAKTIDEAFTKAFGAVERTIAKAAMSGKLSVKGMVDAIVSDLDRIAIRKFVSQPLTEALASLTSSMLTVSGTRAGGGPVSAGNAYLVGEQGPELFVPASSGMVKNEVASTARPQVVLNVSARDANGFRKSEGQITAMMLRALKRGQRNV